MPRKSATTAAELEQQAATDSALGDLDDQGLERLPDFGEPSHEQQLADLDARADRLNGTARCDSPAAWGVSCNFDVHHEGRHSWQSDDGEDLTRPAEGQTELPGTPEQPPEPTDYDIPYEAQFQKRDYQVATGIGEIALRLIEQTEEFAHLRGIKIRYYWKRRGGLKGGNARLGNLQKAGGIGAFEAGQPVYFLWLAADHCRDWKPMPEQIDALIFTQLCKAAVDPDDHDSYRVLGPDFEGYTLAVRRYGLGWQPDLRELGANIKQLGLLENLELPDPNDQDDDAAGDDADEGEESE